MGLGRGFEPLDKGLKPFAFTGLCHASGPFSRAWGFVGSSLYDSVGVIIWGEGVPVVLALLFRSFRTGESAA